MEKSTFIIVNVYSVIGFRPNQITCIAHIIVLHMPTCTAHICLLYKGTDVYSFMIKYSIIHLVFLIWYQSMPKSKGRNRRNCSSCSNRNRSNKWKTKVVHGKHTPNSGISPKLLSRPWILHNTSRIIKDNAITQLS